MNFLERFHEDLTKEKNEKEKEKEIDIDAIADRVVAKLLNAEKEPEEQEEPEETEESEEHEQE